MVAMAEMVVMAATGEVAVMGATVVSTAVVMEGMAATAGSLGCARRSATSQRWPHPSNSTP